VLKRNLINCCDCYHLRRDNNICKQIKDQINAKEWKNHQWFNYQTGTYQSESEKELDVQSITPELQQQMMPLIVNALRAYQDIAALYVKARDTNPPTKDSLKVFIFSVLIADIRNSVHMMEAAASDTYPLMKKDPKLFFQALDEIEFCTESACTALREYFDLYENPGKDEFISRIEPIVRDSLKFTAEKCLESLKK